METSALTFKLLDERIEALPEHPSQQTTPDRRARWGYALIAISGTLGLLFGKLLPPTRWVAILLGVLLVVEIIGLIMAVSADLPSLKSLTFAKQRSEFAEVLDFDMPHHESLVAWVRSFPCERLEAMSDFSVYRLEQYRNKMPILTGGIDKLGALPIFAALVIQFKDMTWPPHPSLWQIVLFTVLTFFYWLCVLAMNQRLRLELYDMLLKKALA